MSMPLNATIGWTYKAPSHQSHPPRRRRRAAKSAIATRAPLMGLPGTLIPMAVPGPSPPCRKKPSLCIFCGKSLYSDRNDVGPRGGPISSAQRTALAFHILVQGVRRRELSWLMSCVSRITRRFVHGIELRPTACLRFWRMKEHRSGPRVKIILRLRTRLDEEDEEVLYWSQNNIRRLRQFEHDVHPVIVL